MFPQKIDVDWVRLIASFINPWDIKVRQPKGGGEAEVGVVGLDGWPGLAAPYF